MVWFPNSWFYLSMAVFFVRLCANGRNNAQQCWELLRTCWQWCANGCNNSQQCWDLRCIVGRILPVSLCKPCVMRVRGPNNVGKSFTGEKCLIGRYQTTWHKVNSTWRQSRPSCVYSRRKKKNWSPPRRHLFEWSRLFTILLFLLFLWDSFTAMFAFWFTGCDF